MSIPLEGHYLLLFNVQTFMTIFFAADKHALRNVDLTVRSDVTLPSGESATPCCRIHVISSSLSLSLPISYCQIWQGPCPESSFPTVRSVYAISRLMHLMHRTIRYIFNCPWFLCWPACAREVPRAGNNHRAKKRKWLTVGEPCSGGGGRVHLPALLRGPAGAGVQRRLQVRHGASPYSSIYLELF